MSHPTMSPEQLAAYEERQQTARKVSPITDREDRLEAEARAKGTAVTQPSYDYAETVAYAKKMGLPTESPQERATGSIPAFVSPKPTERWRDGKRAHGKVAPHQWTSQKPGKLPEPTEHEIQASFFAWARPYLRTKGIDPRLCYAVPNSQILMGKRSAKERAKIMAYLRAEGFTDGIPDIHLDVPMWSRVSPLACTFHGLRLELKRKGGRATTEQIEIIDLLRRRGFNALIVEGYDEAERALKEYVERIGN